MRGNRYRALSGALAAGAALVLAIVVGCLPDLPPKEDDRVDDVDAATQAFSGCGDGFIETLDDGGDAGESCDPGDASVAGCQECHFVCAGAMDEAGHCYFLVEDTDRYSAAIAACAREDAHIVTFSSEREVAFAAKLLASQDAGDAPYWVGLSLQNELEGSGGASPFGPPPGVEEPGWPGSPNPCSGCFAVGADPATNAFPPLSDAGGTSDCLVAVGDAGWFSTSCAGGSRTFKTLCEREPVGQRQFFCGGAYCTTIPLTVGRKRYVISLGEVTAAQAEEECRVRYESEDGSLVIFETREEREQLVHEIRKRFTEPMSIWIGLALADGGSWSWDDGVPDHDAGRPSPWGDQQPSATGDGRAFLLIRESSTTTAPQVEYFDTQLAYSDDGQGPGALRQYVCQRRVR